MVMTLPVATAGPVPCTTSQIFTPLPFGTGTKLGELRGGEVVARTVVSRATEVGVGLAGGLNVRVSGAAAAALFPAKSAAAPAATLTVTAPPDTGATLNVYVFPSTWVKLPTVPLVTLGWPAVNPVTSSLKVTVNGIGFVSVGSGTVEVIVAVGAVV